MTTVSYRYPNAPVTMNEEILDIYEKAINGDAESQYKMG